MSKGPHGNQPSLPEWWNTDLYKYLKDEDFPLAGWVWEFMRRDRLKMLTEQPVEAMNPALPDEDTPKHLAFYYRPWHRLPRPWRSPGRIFSIRPAIHWDGITLSPFFRHTYFGPAYLELEDGSVVWDPFPPAQWERIEVDLNRSNAIILRDLESALKEARKRYPNPTRVNPREEEWHENQILEVWDLCEFPEFNRSWSQIVRLPGIMFESKKAEHYDRKTNITQSAKNAYRSAERLIQGKEWKFLALLIADVLPPKQIAKPAQELMERTTEQEAWEALQALDAALDNPTGNNELKKPPS